MAAGSMESMVVNALVIALLIGAVWTDLRQRRIPNWLTLPAMLAGLALNTWIAGSAGAVFSLQGWLIGLLVLIIPFLRRWMGAGDVKLLAALGALKGPDFVLATALVGAVVGGIAALAMLAKQRRLKMACSFLYALWNQPNPEGSSPWVRMPYGPALALGAVAAFYLGRGV